VQGEFARQFHSELTTDDMLELADALQNAHGEGDGDDGLAWEAVAGAEFESPSIAVIWICTAVAKEIEQIGVDAVAQEIEQIGADAGPIEGMAARVKLECEKFEVAYNLALVASYSPKWLWDAAVVCGLQPVVAATVIEEARCPPQPPAPPGATSAANAAAAAPEATPNLGPSARRVHLMIQGVKDKIQAVKVKHGFGASKR
jgi:hypothetical protein